MRNKPHGGSPEKRSKLNSDNSEQTVSPSSNYSAESDGDSVGVSSISEPLTSSPPSQISAEIKLTPGFPGQLRPLPSLQGLGLQATTTKTLEQELSRPYFPLFLGNSSGKSQTDGETRKVTPVNQGCLPALQYSAMANIESQLRLEQLTRMTHLMTHSTFPGFPFKQRPLAERLYLEALKSKSYL